MSSMNRGRFGERTVLWDGLGINVKGERSVEDVLYKAGTDWQVGQSPVFTGDGTPVKAIRQISGETMGISWAWSVINIRWCRMRKPLYLQRNCSSTASATNLLGVIREEKRHGC